VDQLAARRVQDLNTTTVLPDQRAGDLDGLRARIHVGAADAVPLIDPLTRQGRDEEAERLRRLGLNLDGSIACA
jgi:hypothetical protein